MEILNPEKLTPDFLNKFPLFFQENYFKYQENESIKCILISDDLGNLIPLRIYKKSIFKTAQFLYVPMNETGRLSVDDELKFLSNLLIFLKKNKISDALLAPLHVCLFQQPFPGISSQKLGIMYVNLSESEELIFAEFSKTYRTQIRQCEKEGFTLSDSESHLDNFFENYKYHHVKQGKAHESLDNLTKILQLLPQNCKLISVVNGKGKWEGSVLLLFDREIGFYFIGSKDELNPTHNGSQKFLHWKIMQFLKERNVLRYNLGGHRFNLDSTDKFQSIQDFKAKFGSEVEVGYHFSFTLSPKYKLFKLLARIKNFHK
jgi:lipid II:glycine glycyltransferase (peptidoglycan interpeptide bridge formation enzyme)